MYCAGRELTADQLIKLFVPQLSPEGSNRRSAEQVTMAYWRDWLVAVEGKGCFVHYLGSYILLRSSPWM